MSKHQTRRDFLEQWGLSSLKINLGFLQGKFKPRDSDRTAWELYIELLTRIIAKWLRLSLLGAFNDLARHGEFRSELSALQPRLRNYAQALAAMANVEDLTVLEEIDT